MKKYGFQNFCTFKNNLTTGFSQKNQPGCISTAAAKSLIFRSTANFKNFEIYLYFVCQPASQPAIRPGSARCMAPDLSHNKGNHVGFTKMLFR